MKYIITSTRVLTFEVEAPDQETAESMHYNGESRELHVETIALTICPEDADDHGSIRRCL